MIKYLEPEVIDPRELDPGDQIGCLSGGARLQVMTCDPDDQIDPIWVSLCNAPGETACLWGEPVPAGNIAMDLAGWGWKVLALPQVWARKVIK